MQPLAPNVQANVEVIALTGNPALKFLRCRPAPHTGGTGIRQQLYARRSLDELEVTEEVFESPASIMLEQAENPLHTIKALTIATIGTPA